MLEFKNVEVSGIRSAIMASGFPKRLGEPPDYEVKPITADLTRVQRLGGAESGSGHDCFLKGITVSFDLKYPQYFSMQLQRYHFLDIVSSQSKMHSVTEMWLEDQVNKYTDLRIVKLAQDYITEYNRGDWTTEEEKQDRFQRVVSNLPMGLELWMRVTTNYLQLKTLHMQRKNHRLVEWQEFCDWCETLPHFLELTGNIV